MNSGEYILHVISHTHWDREWYQEFQGYRQRLVYQTDGMLDLLEKRPEYRAFHLDGQTAVLEDYLEIKPDARERLARLVREGRVIIGPWYVMPDERLLCGESMVRNLLLGHRICRQWQAEPMPVGYVTDIFGHVSQFPQILAGFNIRTALLHRGTTFEEERSEMVWEGADGTETLVIKVYPHTGYNDFMTFREWSDEELLDYEENKIALATTRVLYALDGNDHQPAKWDVPEEIARVNGVFRRIECVHSTLSEYLDALGAEMGGDWRKGRPRLKGELGGPARAGTWSETMNGIGSSRPCLKQANDALEYLLPRVAEPLHAWAAVAGGQSQKGFLDRAWRYLLLNHPHDSICGCSIDQVHRDMMYRFDQARLLAENSILESIQSVGDAMDTSRLGEGSLVVTAFNLAAAQTGPVTRLAFEVRSDAAGAKADEELVPAFFDEEGRAAALEVERIERAVRPRPFTFITHALEAVNAGVMHRSDGATALYRPRHGSVDRWHVRVAAKVGAMGCGTWRVGFVPAAEAERAVAALESPRAVQADAAGRSIENEFLRLTVRADASVDIHDKALGVDYLGLHVLEDCGDAGDGWNHFYPESDRRILSTKAARNVRIEAVEAGRLSASLKIAFSMRVPADLEYRETRRGAKRRRAKRSRKTVELGVETVFTLDAGSRRVDCRTAVRNAARCHRLSVLLPTGRKTERWFSDSACDVVERAVALPDTVGWKERAREEKVIKNFAAACDDKAGLAVITRGLNEAAVRDDAERTLALTLFRAFREVLNHEETLDSQLVGEVVSEYAILPFTPEEGRPAAGVLAAVERYKMPVWPYTREARAGRLPLDARLLEVSDGVEIATIKTAEEGRAVVVRVWNASARAVEAAFNAHFPFSRAWRADSLETPRDEIPSTGGRARLALRAKEIATIRFDLG